MHGSQDYFFPYTLFLIWVWLFEICKKRYGGGTGLCSKLVLIRLPPPTGCLRGASLGMLLESATEGRSKCSHLHRAGLGKVQKRWFFPLFFKHSWGAQQNSLGPDALERGRMFPRSCARAASLPGAGAGRDIQYSPKPGSVSSQPGASPPPWEQGKGSIPVGESGLAAPSVRAPLRHRLQPAREQRRQEQSLTVRRDSDLARGNSDFPQRRVVRAWVI